MFGCLLLKQGNRMTCFLNSTGMSLFSHVFTVNDVHKWFGQGIVFNINLCRIKDHFATGRGVECVSINDLRIWFEFLVLNLGAFGKSMQSNATTHEFSKCC